VQLTTQQFIIGFIEYARIRGAAGVLRFDASGWPVWSTFLCKLKDEVRSLLPRSLELKFDWDAPTPLLREREDIGRVIDRLTQERWLGQYIMLARTIGRPELEQYFPKLAEVMFERAKQIPGFLYFRS